MHIIKSSSSLAKTHQEMLSELQLHEMSATPISIPLSTFLVNGAEHMLCLDPTRNSIYILDLESDMPLGPQEFSELLMGLL